MTDQFELTEDQRAIREAARAFTGWYFDNLTFKVDPAKHDAGTKTFLGRTGAFDAVAELGTGRHVQLGARRADFADQPDQPFDIGAGRGIDRQVHGLAGDGGRLARAGRVRAAGQGRGDWPCRGFRDLDR